MTIKDQSRRTSEGEALRYTPLQWYASLTMAEKEPPPRRYPRKQLQKGMLVAWQGAGARRTDRAKTLGMGGLYIETADPPAAGTFIQLLVDTPEGEVRARAVIRNADPGRGMGVEFVGMDQAARTHLHSLLKRLLPGTA